jgi:hypothetical protein
MEATRKELRTGTRYDTTNESPTSIRGSPAAFLIAIVIKTPDWRNENPDTALTSKPSYAAEVREADPIPLTSVSITSAT